MTVPVPRVDGHVHILNLPLAPDEFLVGQRLGFSRAEMKLLLEVVQLVRRLNALPEPVDEMLRVVDQVLDAVPWTSQRWQGVKELLRLYVLPTRKAVQHLYRHLDAHHVRLACLLVPDSPGLTLSALSTLVRAVHDEAQMHFCSLHVFIPTRFWGSFKPGYVTGVKAYPSMECYFTTSGETPNIKGYPDLPPEVPIISHCSPGGIRVAKATESYARKMNEPGQWSDLLHDRKMRLCLAHAGGVDRMLRWLLEGQFEPGANWSLDNMLRDSCPGMSEVPGELWVDVAFHERMFEEDYAEAIGHASPWWKFIPATDYPLHLPYHSYERAMTRLTQLFPDGSEQLLHFLTGVRR